MTAPIQSPYSVKRLDVPGHAIVTVSHAGETVTHVSIARHERETILSDLLNAAYLKGIEDERARVRAAVAQADEDEFGWTGDQSGVFADMPEPPIYPISDRAPEYPCWLRTKHNQQWDEFIAKPDPFTRPMGIFDAWSPISPLPPTKRPTS